LKAGTPESLEAFALSSLPASQPIRLYLNPDTKTHLKKVDQSSGQGVL